MLLQLKDHMKKCMPHVPLLTVLMLILWMDDIDNYVIKQPNC